MYLNANFNKIIKTVIWLRQENTKINPFKDVTYQLRDTHILTISIQVVRL